MFCLGSVFMLYPLVVYLDEVIAAEVQTISRFVSLAKGLAYWYEFRDIGDALGDGAATRSHWNISSDKQKKL